jgi:hypothetical protein
MSRHGIYGVVAEFEDPGALVEAARVMHERGVRHMEAYSPYPIRQLDEYIEARRILPLLVLIGGILGALTGWLMEVYIAGYDYPTNIGGRPLYSWPSFIPIMFELTILFASVTAFFGMLGLAGFPRPHHSIFEMPGFDGASNNRFFLCVEARDPYFDRDAITELFSQMDPLEVREIEEV